MKVGSIITELLKTNWIVQSLGVISDLGVFVNDHCNTGSVVQFFLKLSPGHLFSDSKKLRYVECTYLLGVNLDISLYGGWGWSIASRRILLDSFRAVDVFVFLLDFLLFLCASSFSVLLCQINDHVCLKSKSVSGS
jgi:hypothetical protein